MPQQQRESASQQHGGRGCFRRQSSIEVADMRSRVNAPDELKHHNPKATPHELDPVAHKNEYHRPNQVEMLLDRQRPRMRQADQLAAEDNVVVREVECRSNKSRVW